MAQLEKRQGMAWAWESLSNWIKARAPALSRYSRPARSTVSPAGRNCSSRDLQFGLQGGEVIQGQPAGEGQGDLLAGFAGNADGVPGC